MRIPFTQQQFLDVFGAYNATAWPVVIALWLVTFAFGVGLVRGQARSVALSALAAVHWAWSGLVYHALFFTDINSAAWWFAGVFLLEAFAFVWFGMVRRTLVFEWGRTARHAMAGALFAYSLGYPFLVLASGHDVPRGAFLRAFRRASRLLERRVKRVSERNIPRVARERRSHLAGYVGVPDTGVWIGKAKRAA